MKGLFSQAVENSRVTGLTPKRQDFIRQMVQDPSLYVWGCDPEDGTAIVRTLDKADPMNPMKPMPMWPYLPFVLAEVHAGFLEAKPQLPGLRAVDKPRQLMVSWLALMYGEWLCLAIPHARVLVNKATQDEAEFLIRDRLVEVIHRNWPDWFREWAKPRWKETEGTLYYDHTGSSMAATGENVDDRAARGEQATMFFVDEAARQPRLREVVASIYPMTQLILLVSTPEAGSPGAAYYAEILERDKN